MFQNQIKPSNYIPHRKPDWKIQTHTPYLWNDCKFLAKRFNLNYVLENLIRTMVGWAFIIGVPWLKGLNFLAHISRQKENFKAEYFEGLQF